MIIKNKNVRIEDRPQAGDERRIELLEEGGVVRGLEVRCRCGEVIVVEFEYENPEPPPAS